VIKFVSDLRQVGDSLGGTPVSSLPECKHQYVDGFPVFLMQYRLGRQENFWAPEQKETWPPSSNSPNNETQTKSTTVCHKQGISTTKMN
jgi:hypothetical protein